MSRRRFNAARTFGLLVVATLAFAFVSYAVFDAASRQSSSTDRAQIRAELSETRNDLGVTRDRLDDQSAASTALAEQVESLGEEPVVEPGAPTSSTSRLIPIPGPRGPAVSFAVVLRAVGSQIGDALAASCDGSCEGAPGESIQGPPGESIQGPPGESIVGPKGESIKGDTGGQGPEGKPGRGIVTGPTCNEDGTWTTTFTDGTTETQSGPCRVGLLPMPEPTPTP